MPNRNHRVSLSVLFFLGISSSVFADLTARQQIDAKALIAQFSDPQFTVRQQAVQKLIALGPDVVPIVKKALAETKDNEVKMRCTMVLKGIAEAYGVPVDAGDMKRIFEAAQVTVDAKDLPLADVVQMIADQSGNRALAVADDVKKAVVSFHARDTTYWECLDRLCAQTGLIYGHTWPPGELKLQKPYASSRDVGARSGPVVVKLERATWTRRLRVARDGGNAPAPEECLVYSLAVWWEDRLPVIACGGRVTKATASDGRALRPIEGVAWAEGEHGRAHPGVSITGTFANPAAGGDRLASLEGIARLDFGDGERDTRVDGIVAARGRLLTVEGAALRVSDVRKGNGMLVVKLALEPGSTVRALPEFGEGPRYGFFLASGGLPRRRGFLAPDDRTPGGYVVTFTAFAEGETEWSMLCVSPRWRETREFPFVIQQVPVP